MNFFCFIGEGPELAHFKQNLHHLPYDFYLWKSYRHEKNRKKINENCLLFIDDIENFLKVERQRFYFIEDFSHYSHMMGILMMESYRVDQILKLQHFIEQAGGKFNIVQTSSVQFHKRTYQYYLGSYRDWLYGLIHRQRFQKIALVVRESNYEQEYKFWQNEKVFISKNPHMNKADLIIIKTQNVSSLLGTGIRSLFFHPYTKDCSWALNESEYHIYLSAHSVKLLQSFPIIFMTSLLKFYRYRFL